MAESFIFSIAESLATKIASRAYEEASQVVGVYDDLQELKSSLSCVKGVLLDAEQKQEQNHELREWLKQIKLIFHDAEEVLDQVDCEILRKQVIRDYGTPKDKVGRFFSSSNPLVFRCKLAHQIKDIRRRLDRVAADRDKFGLQVIDVDRRVVHSREMTYSHVVESDVIGRDYDKEKIVKLLMEPSPDNNGDSKHFSVISIVGIGGLGKTTLAKLVFNDERIIDSFPFKIINAASNFVSTGALPGQQNLKELEVEQLQYRPRNMLKGQKFFLVLDDVWNEDRVKWVALEDLISVGARRSVDSMSLQKLLKRFKCQTCQILYFILMKGKKDNLVLALAPGKAEDLHTLPELPLSYVKDCLYGRGEEEKYILESLLLSSEQQKQIKVISIVGKSGVGKTSLADVVYFNPKVLECFDLRAWVTFPHKVTATFVAKKILEELVTDDDGEEELVPGDDFDNFKKRFAGKKLLLVLDDIMVEDDGLHKWDMLIASLESAAARGSGIMLTSIPHDNPELLMIPACHTVHLDSLSAEDALSIFLVHASSGRTDLHEHPGELAAVGKEIVGKLGNLPLAAKMIGSLFQDKRNPDQWVEILRSELLDAGHANLLPIPPFLVLCYLDLPARIKQCFLHLSLFPKGYQLKRKQVVNLWIAEGFVESPDFQSSFKSSEDIGNAYFSYLVMRSFLQPVRSSVSFIMHNLVHDLATYMVEKLNDCHLSSNQSTEGISNLINLLHLDMKGSSVQGMPLKIPEFTMSEFEEIPDEARMETESARRRLPLHLSASDIPSLKRTDILSHEVEADIPSFEQQIDPKSSMAKVEIPASIKQEAVLPLMDTPNTTAPVKVEALTREDLDDDKPSFKVLRVSTISQFKSLPANLHSLKIEGCESLEVVPDDLLGGITTLKQLYLISCSSLRSFPYPGSLTSLYIRNCRRLEFLPSAVSRKRLPFLHHLSIGSSCDSVTTLPLNIFCQLKSLCIWDCHNLGSFHFTGEPRGDLTSLESLEIRECPILESFPEEGLHAPRLASILLSNCKNLKNLPNAMNSLASLKSLFLHRCPQIESFPLGGLPSNLVFLSIAYCDKLTPQKDWGLYSLESLSYFELEGGCIGMESFPEENLLPCNIISLHISTLKSLKNLDCKGFQHLNALQTLEIHCCDMLQSLSNHGLPSSLEKLCIQECPLLTLKLESMMGDEWHKVAHIPDIQIDHQLLS